MTPELEKKIVDAADADFIVGKTRPIGTRERYLYEEKRESFLNGVSFGRKGMYTEEEVRELFINRSKKFSTQVEPFNAILLKQDIEWFDQNKKKEE